VRARHTRLVSGNVEVVSLFGLQQLQRRKLRVTCTSFDAYPDTDTFPNFHTLPPSLSHSLRARLMCLRRTKARALLEQGRLKVVKNPDMWLLAIRTEQRHGNQKAAESLMVH
jgi:hypothetical protein